MSLDPAKVKAGRNGGRVTARRRMVHLTDAEFDVMRDMQQQVRAYQTDTAGAPGAVAVWLRALAGELEER